MSASGGSPPSRSRRDEVLRDEVLGSEVPTGLSRPMAVHQFVPVLHHCDAVGEHTLALRNAFRQLGIRSEIYVEEVSFGGGLAVDRNADLSFDETHTEDPGLALRPLSAYPKEAQPGDLLLYQMATASRMATFLEGRSEPLAIYYHGITPPRYFEAWDASAARLQRKGEEELRCLASRAEVAVAASEFTRRDLVEAGYRFTACLPPAGVLKGTPGAHERRSVGTRAEGDAGRRWLTVGRLAPNKAVEDVIAALLVYRRLYDPLATLDVVGRRSIPAYAAALEGFARDMGLAQAVRFRGQVSEPRLASLYSSADVLVVASEHEGFCVPLVEALAFGVPVLAYAAGAIPEVLGGAGVLLQEKSPLAMAAAVQEIVTDSARKASLREAGSTRLEEIGTDMAAMRLASMLVRLGESPGESRGRSSGERPGESVSS